MNRLTPTSSRDQKQILVQPNYMQHHILQKPQIQSQDFQKRLPANRLMFCQVSAHSRSASASPK
jgi:hypothetical protein